MSTKTAEREVKAKRLVTVYGCDGPECTKAVDVCDVRKGVPPGWIFVRVVPPDIMAEGEIRHYCSRDCLADAVVP